MTQEMCVLPVQCSRCGTVFDLWYDLQQLEPIDGGRLGSDAVLSKRARQSLCWRCRQVAMEALKVADNKLEELEDDSSVEELVLTFE